MPLSILLIALDPKFMHYGYSAKAFFNYFYSERISERCSLLRKGLGISAVYRKGGPTNFVANPCKEEFTKMESIKMFMKATVLPPFTCLIRTKQMISKRK